MYADRSTVKGNVEATGKDKLSDDEVYAQIKYTHYTFYIRYSELMTMTGHSSSLAMKRAAPVLVGRSTCSRRTRGFKPDFARRFPRPRLKLETNKFLLRCSLLSLSLMPS